MPVIAGDLVGTRPGRVRVVVGGGSFSSSAGGGGLLVEAARATGLDVFSSWSGVPRSSCPETPAPASTTHLLIGLVFGRVDLLCLDLCRHRDYAEERTLGLDGPDDGSPAATASRGVV